MFILICVFDPLAVMLVISLNIALVGGGNGGTPRRAKKSKDYKKEFEKWKEGSKKAADKLKDFMTDFDKEVMEEKPKSKGEVVKEHIKDKLTEAVRDSIKPLDKNGNPLEAWKRKTEGQIDDENYPYNGAGNGIDMGTKTKSNKPDSYDEDIQSTKMVRDSQGNWITRK
tara:strand:+ start:9 stop:515 length:507 start_codon:yes stop_codon:yes gene_type:complete